MQDSNTRDNDTPASLPGQIEYLAYCALTRYGPDKQKRQTSEECIELALALHHLERGKAELLDVAVEVADVEMMLEQMRLLIPVETMDIARRQQHAKLAAKLGVSL